MKRAAGSAAPVGALVLAGVAYGGRTTAAGQGILLLQTEANPRLQQILLWRPGTSPQPLGSSSDWILRAGAEPAARLRR